MKKHTFVILSAAVCGMFLLSACGGASGSSGNSDAPLGRVPAIYVDVAAKKKALDEELRGEKDMDRYQKKLKAFDENEAESYQKAAKEGEKIKGREVPISGDMYEDFRVTGAKVESFQQGKGSGSVIVRVMVTPKRDIIVRDTKRACAEGEHSLKDTRLYYVLMKANDHMIAMGEINPFNSNYANSSLKAEYIGGQMVQAGVPCHSEGSPVAINCHTYDFTEFAKIVFLRAEDYAAIRKQAYGF